MKKYLRCHTEAFGLTKGALYQIRREDDEDYMIIDDIGIRSYYGIYSDDGDGYYGDYFTLEFVPDSGANITVLKDDSLGGIEREYREVKRKANVGERIKITAEKLIDEYRKGEIYTVTRAPKHSDLITTNGKWSDRSALNVITEEYVVLESTDIIRIDGERLRMVDRKAAVGERVIVTNWLADKHVDGSAYKNGDVATTINNEIFVQIPHDDRIGYVALLESEYRVLEPIESAQLSAQPPFDQAAATISALTAKMQTLESRVDMLEMANKAVKVAEGPADDMPPSFAKRCQTLQEIRDEIVERAKTDVKALAENGSALVQLSDGYCATCDVKFVVSRDKRKVTALLTGIRTGKVRAVGRAKAAPNDVFNAHIGRAIALRRALGLEVPAEYLNAPNPEEPRVGDVVCWGIADRTYRIENGMRVVSLEDGRDYTDYAYLANASIVDDSREEVGA